MIYLQLFLSFLKIGAFSFGRRICSNANDTAAGGRCISLAVSV